jgi:circadian clock protein KaiB
MKTPREPPFKFSLFVADNTENSEIARTNLAAMCATYLPGRCEIEIIDILRDASRAEEMRVTMTPTLVKVLPLPERRIAGTLTDAEGVLATLGIKVVP